MAINLPRINLQILSATVAATLAAQKVLIIGQMTSSGTATPLTLYSTIPNDSSWDTLGGRDSQAARMIRAFKLINPISQLDVIFLADAADSIKAVSTNTLTGTATAAGSLKIVIGSQLNNSYTVNIALNDAAADIIGHCVTAINADTTSSVTASAGTGTLILTAKNAGTEGNHINLNITGGATGITYTVVPFTTGATDPVLTGIPALIANIRYQGIVTLGSYVLTPILTELATRFNPLNKILDGNLFIGKNDSKANLVSYGNSYNSQSFNIIGHQTISNTNYIGSAMPEFDYVVAAQFAAIRALRLSLGTNIASYVVGSVYGSKDAFGGAHTASLPYFNTPMSNLPIMPNNYEWTDQDQIDLRTAGISCIENNVSRTTSITGEIVTTYKTDALGNVDPSFKYLEYVDTISACREYIFVSLKARFAQSRLTTGDAIVGYIMANQPIIAGVIKGYYNDLADLALVQSGDTFKQAFSDSLVITINLAARKATIAMVLPIVTQLGQIDGTIQMSFMQQTA
jgi:phage tail sheath gpL-like